MSTINKKFYADGICDLEGNHVTIEIKYISLPEVDRTNKKFMKMENKCFYLGEGRCDKKKECSIYKNAAEIQTNY